MSQIITVNPTNYVAKLKEHVEPMVKIGQVALKNAQELVIKTDDDLKLAKEDWVKHRLSLKDTEDARTALTKPLNDALGLINGTFKDASTPLTEAREILNQKSSAYERKKEAERQEAARLAREAAAKEEARLKKIKEDQEREWREKEAERTRQAEELARKAAREKDAEKRAEMEAAAEKQRQEAAKAREKADLRAQEAQETFIPTETVEKTVVKVTGAKAVVRYFFEVLDAKIVPVEWCGKTIRPVDEKVLGEIAKGLKLDNKAPSPIPGIRFWSENKLG